ncbi:MAG: ABC transporter permease [Bacteroidales bacterium]|nr:ABC transporter permease [Bacteroidales bacterium]
MVNCISSDLPCTVMTILKLIRSNLVYYSRKNLLLALGVAISGAVLTGALVVGDSVEYSLNRIVDHRLGALTHVLKAGDRYFTAELGERVGEQLGISVSSILLQEGSAVDDGGARRINHIQMLGVDQSFDKVAGLDPYYGTLSGDSIIISRNLANRLSVKAGDELLLRIEKASLIPRNAPFVSDAESVVTLRAMIKEVADDDRLGRFNLKVSQTAPFNIFISLESLGDLMDFSGRANVMLFRADGQAGGSGAGTEEIREAVGAQFSAADAGLKLHVRDELRLLEITSDRVFIDDALTVPLSEAAAGGEGILTYFVNRIESASGAAPYSFVSTLPAQMLKAGEVIINEWLAEDLSAQVGDTLEISYFKVGPLRELTDTSATFVLRSIVPMEGRYGDGNLMPDLPGLSDAGNCRDWDTGVPISLESIRDKDEDYWDDFGGIPKAFISVEQGEKLWKNRFGTYTSFRYSLEGAGMAAADSSVEDLTQAALTALEGSLMEKISPAMLGFTLEDTRTKGYEAAGEGIDFSQLFGGLSFFLLASGLLLIVLLFLLNLESRSEQLRTLVVMGIPLKSIRRFILGESMLVTLVGALAGTGLSVVYNKLVFMAMNGVWSGVIRTQMMFIDIRISTLLTGLLATLLIALLAIWFPMNRKLKRHFSAYKKQDPAKRHKLVLSRKGILWISVSTGLTALTLIASQLVQTEIVNVALFFSAGGLLLLSAVLFFYWLLSRTVTEKQGVIDLQLLSTKNARRNLTRSMSIVILFAIGAFLVISTGSNRKDLFSNAGETGSGTGGFLYYAESTAPVLKKLNNPEVQYEFGLSEGYSFVQLRKADGDDASCLNLNKIVNPQILGVDPAMLDGRFSFVTRTPYLDEAHPWLSLRQELDDGVIPAIADETVIKWGLGLEVGDTLRYTNSRGETMSLLLIGGLAPSVFQGNVLIDDRRFLEQFPESSGTHVFLVDGAMEDTAQIASELGRGMRDLGWDMELSASRLAEFNSVTNAYLSIFMVLGALGLLVGTFGLVVILWRSVMERSREIALLKAVGYSRKEIRKLVVREYMFLLLMGIGTGFVTAVVATLPSILNAHTGTSFFSILAWLAVLVFNGWFWIHLVARSALKNESLYTALRNE